MVLAVEDIIQEMRSRPEVLDSVRRVILTDELLELPQRFSGLVGRIDLLTGVVERNSADIAELRATVKELVRVSAENTAATQKNSADIAELRATVKELVRVSAENTVAIQKNSADIAELRAAISELRAAVEELVRVSAENRVDIKRLDDRLAYYRGMFLEHEMPRILSPRLAQQLKLKRARAQYHHNYWPTHAGSFLDRIETIYEKNEITDAQYYRILYTDLVMNALRMSDGEEVWIAAEASGTIGGKDIDRAADSAQILAAAFDADTYAVVIGHRIHDMDRRRAQLKDVIVILVDRSEVDPS